METRLCLLLVLAGLPPPQVQVPLYDDNEWSLGRPDLYYPTRWVGLEYDGGTGFRLLRFTAADVYNTPNSVVAQVRAALKAHLS